MTTLELVFPARGTSLPTDHAYPLYGALSAVVPDFHKAESPLRFAPITGIATPNGRVQMAERSCLRVRLPDDMVKLALPLAGRRLDIAGESVRLGVPALRTLTAAATLVARIVTFKFHEDENEKLIDTPEAFEATARAKLVDLEIRGVPTVEYYQSGNRVGEPQRRVVRLKGHSIIGYEMLVSELSASDSLKLQGTGLGGRTKMGCGWFVPAKGAK